MNKIDTFLKKEFKRYKREKKKCKKLYPDWKDDEKNCLHSFFVWGLSPNFSSVNTNFNTLNILQIYYDRQIQKYCLVFDINYLNKIEQILLAISTSPLYINNKNSSFSNIKNYTIIHCEDELFISTNTLNDLFYVFKQYVKIL